MPKFRKKPVVIEAMQFTGNNAIPADISLWMAGETIETECIDGKLCLMIETLEGRMAASPGDWVIRGVAGEFYPCKPGIFAATYEPVEDDEAGAIDADLVEPQASAPPIDHEVFHCPGDILCEYCDRIAQYHDGAASKPDDEAEGLQL